jgi:hypothetical protein
VRFFSFVILCLNRQTARKWHQARFDEELAELSEATNFIERISEASDVCFAIHRARYDEFPLATNSACPAPRILGQQPGLVMSSFIYAYMLAKYTSKVDILPNGGEINRVGEVVESLRGGQSDQGFEVEGSDREAGSG